METFKQRLKRYTSKNDLEIFGWLTVYLQNSYLGELRLAKENQLHLCVYLITHAVIQTVSENMFGSTGKDGTKFYLENFVDGNTTNKKFSLITDEIHDARNVMAHQGYSSLQHRVEYFAGDMAEGWKQEAGTIYINPNIYAEQFENALSHGTHVQKYLQQSDEIRTIRKYKYIKQWLRLDKTDPIAKEIKKLEACTNINDLRAQETLVQQMIYSAYGLI